MQNYTHQSVRRDQYSRRCVDFYVNGRLVATRVTLPKAYVERHGARYSLAFHDDKVYTKVATLREAQKVVDAFIAGRLAA